MDANKRVYSMLVVSEKDKLFDSLKELLPAEDYYPVELAHSAGEARRKLVSGSYDLLVINAPLRDDFGTQLALDMSDTSMGILLMVKADLYDSVAYKVENCGVFTLAKPNSKQAIYSAVKLLSAMNSKLKKMEKIEHALKEKMADIRIVNRAKWLLIENLKMSENDAHYYIEKQAMDTRMSRREVAQGIIRTYDI
ncbi:MAG: ANTAR domain-containing protein [Clostridia bacterium]|nr:ANTAR domain-containing protein [Clostridia bacterium]